MNRIISLLSVALLLAAANAMERTCSGQATYRVTVIGMWTPERFSVIPPDPHFAPVTGFSHTGRYSAWSTFGYASEGVKRVAQLGDQRKLLEELLEAKQNLFVLDASTQPFGQLFDGDETGSVDVTVDCSHPYISAITMIAPSPDWFIPINRVNVMRNGRFVRMRTGKIFAFDAGTDSGEGFMPDFFTAEDPTEPRENIVKITGTPYFGKPVARFEIKRLA